MGPIPFGVCRIFDGTRCGRMRRMRRALATLLLAVIASTVAGPMTCAGWEATAAERRSCCQRASHDCPDQTAADDCCAAQEQTHQPGTTMAAVMLAVPVNVAAVFPDTIDFSSANRATTTRFETSAFLPPHAPPGSFAQPLRI